MEYVESKGAMNYIMSSFTGTETVVA